MHNSRFVSLLALPGVLLLGSSSQAVAPQRIYWSDDFNGKIQRANLDGSEIAEVVSTADRPFQLALDLAAGKMYWSALISIPGSKTDVIKRANLDGTDAEDLITEEMFYVGGIALDLTGRKLYWTQPTLGPGDRIRRANLDIPLGETADNRSDVEDLVTGLPDHSNPLGIALDVASGRMYWVDSDSRSIRSADLDGSNIEVLLTKAGFLRGIALDTNAGKMYWTTSSKISRADMDGTNIEQLVSSGQDGPYGIALDLTAGKMYWADTKCCVDHWGSIKRANLDGSNTETIVPIGVAMPRRIALDLRCRNGTVDPGEECDDGGESATCDTDCTLAECGDGTANVTSGEECDGGNGCTNCLCNADFEPTAPPSADCQPICGNGSLDPGEECDEGFRCTGCHCDSGFEPTVPPSVNCRSICGNGSIDPGEECDGGLGCTECLCDAGFEPTSPPSLDCQSICGNGTVDPGEDCDGAAGTCPGGVTCESDCTCPPPPTGCCWTCDGPSLSCNSPIVRDDCPPTNLWIEDEECGTNVCGTGKCEEPSSCGDDVVNQASEECDGTDDAACAGQCLSNCSCPSGDIPTVSEWGIALMALLLLVGAKVFYSRRQTMQA